MSVLIIYQSVEGQTRKVALFARDTAQKAGKEVLIFDAADKTARLSLEGVDKVILAAPVHERRHPRKFELLLNASKDELMARPSLLLSVSLSAAFPEGHEEAQEYLTEMEMRTGFKPGAKALIAGAVRTERYDYFATQVIRHIVLRGRDYDPEQGTHEFTNWNALETTLREFLEAKPA